MGTYFVIKNCYFNSDLTEDNPVRKQRLTSLFFYGVLVSCSPETPPIKPSVIPQTDSVLTAISAETERFNSWLDEQWETKLSFSPQSQTALGLKSNYDKLDDYTLEAQDAETEWLRASVDIMEDMFDYQSLSEEGKLSWDMWKQCALIQKGSWRL